VTSRITFISLVLLIAFGAWMRLPRHKDRIWTGTDEGYYAQYVDALGQKSWPAVIADYIEEEKKGNETKLPPTRVLFLGGALVVSKITGLEALECLRVLSWLSAVGTLVVGAIFVSRMSGPHAALAVTAFIACSPLLIHLAHRALIDGFFAFWALVAAWGLWESLRSFATSAAPVAAAPGGTADSPETLHGAQHRTAFRPAVSLTIYAIGLAAMVLTKENAAFAFFALFAIIVLHRWLKIGRVTPTLLVVTFVAPALAACVLVLVAGGPMPLFETYRLNSTKSVVLPYAIKTGDGPWHRYLLDFLLVSPAVTVLAVAALGATAWRDPAKRFLALFLLLSFAVMAQVRYGMNMRYGAMWTLPLCWLAFSLLLTLSEKVIPRYRKVALALSVALVCALELRSYSTLFIEGNIYDPVAPAVAMPLQMWKPNL